MRQKSIKNIRQEFKNNGVFYTPLALAERLKSYVDIEPKCVYDPTCGCGNLLSVFPDNVKKYGQELDAEQINLINLPNFKGYAGDTLKNDMFLDMKFDCIVANPPFSVKWEPSDLKLDKRFVNCPALPPPSKADWAFMLHILYHLSDNGVAVVLEFPGILYRGQKEGIIRQWFIECNYIDRVVNIPGNTFEDTNISTCLVVLKKNKKTTDIIFEDGEKTKIIHQKEVVENGYCLSVSNYIQDDVIKEEVNPIELELHARKAFLQKLENELEFEKTVCEMEGISMQPFINAIKNILGKYEFKTKKGEIDGQLSMFQK